MGADHANVLLTEIRRAVDDAGLTQVELAAALGVDQPRVSNLLRAARGAVWSAEQLLTVERAAGLTPGTINQRVALVLEDYAMAAGSGEDPTGTPSGSTTKRRGTTRSEPDYTP